MRAPKGIALLVVLCVHWLKWVQSGQLAFMTPSNSETINVHLDGRTRQFVYTEGDDLVANIQDFLIQHGFQRETDQFRAATIQLFDTVLQQRRRYEAFLQPRPKPKPMFRPSKSDSKSQATGELLPAEPIVICLRTSISSNPRPFDLSSESALTLSLASLAQNLYILPRHVSVTLMVLYSVDRSTMDELPSAELSNKNVTLFKWCSGQVSGSAASRSSSFYTSTRCIIEKLMLHVGVQVLHVTSPTQSQAESNIYQAALLHYLMEGTPLPAIPASGEYLQHAAFNTADFIHRAYPQLHDVLLAGLAPPLSPAADPVVLLLEDDYIMLPTAIMEMRQLLQYFDPEAARHAHAASQQQQHQQTTIDPVGQIHAHSQPRLAVSASCVFVSPYDHPDAYVRILWPAVKQREVQTLPQLHRHWTTNSGKTTTFTFAGHWRGSIRRALQALVQEPEADYSMWFSLTDSSKNQACFLWTPVASLATHLEPCCVAWQVDWEHEIEELRWTVRKAGILLD